MAELKPCPFCGSKIIRIKVVCNEIGGRLLGCRYECYDCGCNLFAETETKARNKWNTRKEK